MNKFLLILFILQFASCGVKQDKTGSQKDSTIKKENISKKDSLPNKGEGNLGSHQLSPSQVVIKLNENDFKKILGDKYKPWQPTDDDIVTADVLIKQCFEDQKRGTVNYLLNRSIDEYNRQYVGIIDENNDKLIWVNCFKTPKEDYPEWKHQIIIAEGGGNNFFNLKVNISKNSYTDVKINGPK